MPYGISNLPSLALKPNYADFSYNTNSRKEAHGLLSLLPSVHVEMSFLSSFLLDC